MILFPFSQDQPAQPPWGKGHTMIDFCIKWGRSLKPRGSDRLKSSCQKYLTFTILLIYTYCKQVWNKSGTMSDAIHSQKWTGQDCKALEKNDTNGSILTYCNDILHVTQIFGTQQSAYPDLDMLKLTSLPTPWPPHDRPHDRPHHWPLGQPHDFGHDWNYNRPYDWLQDRAHDWQNCDFRAVSHSCYVFSKANSSTLNTYQSVTRWVVVLN